eukprot:231355_1
MTTLQKQDNYETIRETLYSLSIFGLDIEQEILDLIAECASGKLLNCRNNWCENEVLILNEHTCDGIPNRKKPKPTYSKVKYGGIGGKTEIITHPPPPDRKNKISDRSYNDLKFNIKYYYDSETHIAYCYECRKIMKLCGEPLTISTTTGRRRGRGRSWCDGLIFDNQASTYIVCGCIEQKRMCKEHFHSDCKRCNRSSCGAYTGNDFCAVRSCGTCSADGCINCISRIGCDMVLQSYPPQYVNPVYKCKNNGCLNVIDTVFSDDKDYIEFKKKYDLLSDLLETLYTIKEQTVVINIAEYATGEIVYCSNEICGRDILILYANKCIWSKQQRMGWGGMKKECNTFIDWKDENIKYFYRAMRKKSDSIVYCYECIDFIEMCKDGFLEMCNGLIVTNNNKSFNICGCLKKNKICLQHKKCARCNKYVCHDWDKCDGRQCVSCMYKGCSNCIGSNKICMDNGCNKQKPDNRLFNDIGFGMVSVSAVNDDDEF